MPASKHICQSLSARAPKESYFSALRASVLELTRCGSCKHRRHGTPIPEQFLEDSGEVIPWMQADQGLWQASLLRGLLAQAPDGVLIHLCFAHLIAASCDTVASRQRLYCWTCRQMLTLVQGGEAF